MKSFLSRLFAFVLVAVIGLTGCSTVSSTAPSMMSGDYRQDTQMLVDTMRTAITAPEDSAEQSSAQSTAREAINQYAARYRRDDKLTGLNSYTTIRTALNALAGHYSSYPNRPIPQKLKDRLEKELKQVELSLKRGY